MIYVRHLEQILGRLNQFLSEQYRGIWLAGVAGSLAIAGLVAFNLIVDRKQTFDHSTEQAENLALMVEKDISRSFEIYASYLQTMSDSWNDPQLDSLSEDLKRKIIFDRSTTALNITDALLMDSAGRIIIDRGARSFGTRAFEDRDFFQIHKKSLSTDIYLSRPYKSRMSGATNVAFSRRLNKPDGSFGGVAMLTVDVSYFRELLSGLNLGRQGRASLVSGSGVVLMSYPYDPAAVGIDGLESPVFRRALTAATTSFIARSAVDNHERLFVIHTVPKPMLKVMMGLSTNDIYSEWRKQAFPAVIASTVLALLLIISSLMLAKQLREKAKAENRLQLLATTDALTGLLSRRPLVMALEKEVQRSNRDGSPLSAIFIDVDKFKKFNDNYGHLAGDKVLAEVAGEISKRMHRAGDYAGRYGGEEFLLILAQTDIAGAVYIAEEIRGAVERLNIGHMEGVMGRVTVSIGVAASTEKTSSWQELVNSADAALYTAKAAGRNVVKIAS